MNSFQIFILHPKCIYDLDISYSCSIADPVTSSLILTGGYYSLESVSKYTEAGFEADLASLITGRFWHGCGGFTTEAGGGQVLVVTGGVRADLTYLDSTEVMTSGLWREAGRLPVASMMTGLSLDNEVLMFGEFMFNDINSQFIANDLSTGGYDGQTHCSHILRFDKQSESWRAAGNMREARAQHVVTSLPYLMVSQY